MKKQREVKTWPIVNDAQLRQTAESVRSLWRYKPRAIPREREDICQTLMQRLSAQGILTRVVNGFYKGVTAGFHVWLEGSDFILDPAADTFGSDPIYIAHVGVAYNGTYVKD